MAVETDDDRAAFFDTDDFGDTAVWTRASDSAPFQLNVILDRPDELVELAEGRPVRQEVPTAQCRVADLPPGYAKGDAFRVGFDEWTVERVMMDADRTVATIILRA